MSVMAVCLKVCGVTTPWIEASSNHDLSKRHIHALGVAALAAAVGERPPVRVGGLAIPVNCFDVVLEDTLACPVHLTKVELRIRNECHSPP
jgi:hypothetical protein